MHRTMHDRQRSVRFQRWSNQLPAGAYEVAQVGDRATLIETRDGHDKVLGIYHYAGPSKVGETKLVFDKIGDRYFLREIWTSAQRPGAVGS